jgi:hypothetical protein
MIDFIIQFLTSYDTTYLVIQGASWVISFFCLFYLWRRPDAVLRKIIWSFILFIPILGPIFYGGFYKVPPEQPEHLRAANTIHRLGGPGI